MTTIGAHQATPLIFTNDLKASETRIARAVKRAATAEKKLADARGVIDAERARHAALVEQYGRQAVAP